MKPFERELRNTIEHVFVLQDSFERPEDRRRVTEDLATRITQMIPDIAELQTMVLKAQIERDEAKAEALHCAKAAFRKYEEAEKLKEENERLLGKLALLKKELQGFIEANFGGVAICKESPNSVWAKVTYGPESGPEGG
jgi:uncharacterized coiled-coil DUF342 family protein